MSTITGPMPKIVSRQPDTVNDFIYRLSVEQYHQMIKHGILIDDDPVELLEGWLVQKMPKNPIHSGARRKTRALLSSIVPKGWFIDDQEPVTTDDSEPEPDVNVVRGEIGDYMERHPGPQDTGVLVEVANTSLDHDRTVKKRIFARANIPIYWIVNLIDRQIEVYTDPSGPAEEPDYRQRKDYSEAEEVPVVLDDKEVGRLAVRDVMP